MQFLVEPTGVAEWTPVEGGFPPERGQRTLAVGALRTLTPRSGLQEEKKHIIHFFLLFHPLFFQFQGKFFLPP